MQAVQALTVIGGVADARTLLRLTSHRRIRKALDSGDILRVSRGRYALSTASDAARAGLELGGVVCLRSAAAHHGWELKQQPERPEVAVPRGRKVDAERQQRIRVVWMNVGADDVDDRVTTPLRTLIDCARRLPFDEALAVADSALRSGRVTPEDLAGVSVQGAGAASVRRVSRHADGRAANPFESVLRALAIEAGLDVQPQLALDLGSGVVHPDLTDRSLRVVVEADSWTHHATRSGHKRDCARYNLLVLHGWLVLRFTWEQVMWEQAYVVWVLRHVRRVERPELTEVLARPA